MSELLSSYWPVAPEMVLVVGALGLLMLGVFRPEGERDALSIGWLAIAILGAAGSLLLSFDYMRAVSALKFEYPVLVLLAAAGMLLMISANDLIVLYLGLELQS